MKYEQMSLYKIYETSDLDPYFITEKAKEK